MHKKIAKSSIRLIDDDPNTSQSLSLWLIEEDFSTDTAAAWADAPAVVRSKAPAVALAAYSMGKKDGIAAAKKLNKIEKYIKPVILTGFPSYESAVGAMKAGVLDYLPRAADHSTTLDLYHTALDKREFYTVSNTNSRN